MKKKKKCTVCKEEKTLANFHNSKRSNDGKCYRCAVCDREARESYRIANKDRFREVARNKTIRHKYGIEPDEYDKMLKSQSGVCAICGTDNPNGSRSRSTYLLNLAIDHCHKTGRIRGLLCNNCNRGIGLLGDDVIVLRRAIEYLTKQTH